MPVSAHAREDDDLVPLGMEGLYHVAHAAVEELPIIRAGRELRAALRQSERPVLPGVALPSESFHVQQHTGERATPNDD